MSINDYVQKMNDICKREFISGRQLCRLLPLSAPTLMRIRKEPELSSMKTMRKIKKFVDEWEAKNLSVKD